MWFKIAFRNTFRNRRRTALNICMIAGGVAGIILFRGFAFRILYDLRESTIQTQTGHLQVASPAYWSKGAKRPKDALLMPPPGLMDEIRKIPHVTYATGSLSFYGLLSVGDQTFSAQGISLDPQSEKGKNEALHIPQGTRLSAGKPLQVVIGSTLAKKLNVVPHDSVTVLAYTFDGMMNALDVEVAGIFKSGVSEIDDVTFMLPLETVSRLLDTPKVERIVIGLEGTAYTNETTAILQAKLSRLAPGLVVKTWMELGVFYQQAESFFHTQNQIIEGIILALVLLGVLNTIGMSVFERAGEIGTLRALGEREQVVLSQFLLEGAILGFVGACAGMIFAALGAHLINSANLPLILPGASSPFTVRITLFASAFYQAITLALVATVMAALVPAYRASRINIVEALKRNV